MIDTDALRSDRKIRDTLLHEMAHAAAPGDGHGYAFWAQLEKLLRQGAPIRCGIPETGGAFRILAGVIPRKFPRARKAMERIEAARNRKILTAARYSRAQFHQTTEDEIVARFSDLAPGMTERAAVLEVGIEYGLIDVGLKPVNRWAARIIDRGRKAFRLRRRDYLMDQRRWKLLAAGEGTKRRLAEISC